VRFSVVFDLRCIRGGSVRITASTRVARFERAIQLHHPRVDAAIIGPRTPAHLASALGSLDVALSAPEAALAALF
jgi:aryl-alcohol dehydrogenase-like predicted oxidoreductase